MTMVTSELIWLKSLLASLGGICDNLIQLFCDNQTALHIAKNLVFHERTEHIEIGCHFVNEMIASSNLSVGYAPSKYQLVDTFIFFSAS